MKKEEFGFLLKRKEFEGKSQKEIRTEIRNLIDSQKLFKQQAREIKRLNKLVESLEKKLDKKKQDKFLEGLGQSKPKVKTITKVQASPFADTKELRRILLTLNGKTKKSDISKSAEVLDKKVADGLKFLLMYKLIKKEGDSYIRNKI
jgi:hypothetical protein